jgi:AbrB family looped-hinge helix DNA binding protein
MTTTVSTKGQVILPANIRRQDGIEPGQEFVFERIDRGEYRLVRRQPRPNEGLVDWLLACPEKGFFVPGLTIPTRNARDFQGARAKVVNPFA